MTHTVIGFFRNSDDAYHASDILRDRGFDYNNIDVSSSYVNAGRNEDQKERTGKIGNFFKSLFTDDDDNADRYSNYAAKNTLVTVHSSNMEEAQRASAILDECGALDIDESGSDFLHSDKGMASESLLTDTSDKDYNMNDNDTFRNQEEFIDSDIDMERSGRFTADNDYDLSEKDTFRNQEDLSDSDVDMERSGKFTSRKDSDDTSETSIPIIEEEVNVGKREFRRGGVRVRSRIIERPVEETIRLREEMVKVERNPADREATPTEIENFREETIEIDEYAEEPVVSKRSRVVEEVKVGKEVHEKEQTIRETERKTEVDIENLEDEQYEKSHRKG